jgi:hypothetical protein
MFVKVMCLGVQLKEELLNPLFRVINSDWSDPFEDWFE